MKPSYPTGRVVCIIDGLGDLIVASEAFELFKQQYPTHELYVCTWGGIFVESQQYNPHINGLIAIDGQPHVQVNGVLGAGFQRNEIVLLDNICSFAWFIDVPAIQKINEQLQFDPHKLSYFVAEYNNITDAIGWWWRSLQILNLNLANGYALQLCGSLLPENSRPKFYCGVEDTKYSETLSDLGPYVLINHTTGTNKEQKQWPLEHWHSLMHLILDNFPKLSIITVGHPSDIIVPFTGDKAKRIKHLRDTRIREIYPIAEKAAFYVCSQSGLAHIFDCTDRPGVQINIGSPRQIAGNRSPFCTIIDQHKLFDPMSVSLEEAWQGVKTGLQEGGF